MAEVIRMFPENDAAPEPDHLGLSEKVESVLDVDKGLDAIVSQPQTHVLEDPELLPFPEGVPYTLDHTNDGLSPIFLGTGEKVQELNTLAKLGSFALPKPPTTS